MMDGPNTNQISHEKVNHHKWFKLRVHFLSHCKRQDSLEDFNFKSKLGASPFVFQVLHLYLQTRGILPSLSIPSST
jgi:hypothetical protein